MCDWEHDFSSHVIRVKLKGRFSQLFCLSPKNAFIGQTSLRVNGLASSKNNQPAKGKIAVEFTR